MNKCWVWLWMVPPSPSGPRDLILGSRWADVQRSKNQPLGWRKAFKGLLLWRNFPSYCRPGHKEMESLSEVGHVRKQDVSLLLLNCFCKILQQIWRLILGLIALIKQDLKLETKRSWAIPMLSLPPSPHLSLYHGIFSFFCRTELRNISDLSHWMSYRVVTNSLVIWEVSL